MIFNPALRSPTTIGMIDRNLPIVILSKRAHDKMALYVESVNTEIGWLGTLELTEGGDFYIEDVFLLEQEVCGTNTTITEDGQTNLIMELLQSDRKDVLNKLKFWGHSHVNMDVSPSSQDVETLQALKSDVDPDYFLRGIFNKGGKIKFTLYYYESGITIDNMTWMVEDVIDQSLIDEIKAEIAEKVSTRYVGLYVAPGIKELYQRHALNYQRRLNQDKINSDIIDEVEFNRIIELDDLADDLADDQDEELIWNAMNQ